MSMQQTPSFIQSLLVPTNGTQPKARRVWSIDLQGTWIPFFTATNTVGDTHIAPDELGAPIRLGYDKDGSVKFSKTGRPVTKVVKGIAEHIRMVRDNFTAGLISYAQSVATEHPEEFAETIASAKQAGDPIMVKDHDSLVEAQAVLMAKQVAEAEKLLAREKPKSKQKSRDHEGELAGAVA